MEIVMKKILSFLLISCILVFVLAGCSDTNQQITDKDYILTSDNKTSRNITIGSNSNEFIDAYQGCVLTVLYADDNSNVVKETDINAIDYTKCCYVYLPAFFIDDKAIDVENFKNKNNITSDLNSWLENNTEYLQKHKVIFKCLVFTFDDGVITNIQKSEKDFNK